MSIGSRLPRQPERIPFGCGGQKKARILLRERVNWNGCGVRYIEADQKNSTQ
jgi:hypothetical protein